MTTSGIAMNEVEEQTEEQIIFALCQRATVLAGLATDPTECAWCKSAANLLQNHVTGSPALSEADLQDVIAGLEKVDRGE